MLGFVVHFPNMEGYDADTYGERIAAFYDDLYEHLFDTEGAVAFLAELASGGSALELGIGTGRVAVPLAQKDVRVVGIDASPQMIERLRARVGGADIDVVIGDFVDVAVEGSFEVVYVTFNTIFALHSQDDQLRLFRNVAARLCRGGAFIVEAFIPDLTRFRRHQNAEVEAVRLDEVVLGVSRHDPVHQLVTSQQMILRHGEPVRMVPIVLRYAWPSELDLMARLAGLRLRERWGDWRRTPFTSESKQHISVYEPHAK